VNDWLRLSLRLLGTLKYTSGITFQHPENYYTWSPFGSEGAGYRKFYCINLLLFAMVLIRVFSCDKFLYVHQHVTVLISEIIFSVVASVQH